MYGFKETCFLLFAAFAITRGLSASNRQPPCVQVDQTSKDLMSEMLLLLEKLSTDVTNNIIEIHVRWPGEYKQADHPIYINLSQQGSDNIKARLKVDHCILKAFLPILHCAIREFEAVPNTRGIVHKLKDLTWNTRNLIRHFQEARDTLPVQQTANQTTDSVCMMPSCTVRSQSALPNGKRLINVAVSHGKAILAEIQGKLQYGVYPDFSKIAKKQICP